MRQGAIETTYNGIKFRSRLEARWAIFFDEMKIEWLYEPEGFEKEVEEGEVIRYLPDFYLPCQKIWVEVKGELSAMDADKMGCMLDWGSPLTSFDESYLAENDGGLLLLGEIPKDKGLIVHPLIKHHKGLWRTYVVLMTKIGPFPFRWCNDRYTFHDLLSGESDYGEDGYCGNTEIFDPHHQVLDATFWARKTSNAYDVARTFRFYK
jgi:hypothetical protein